MMTPGVAGGLENVRALEPRRWRYYFLYRRLRGSGQFFFFYLPRTPRRTGS